MPQSEKPALSFASSFASETAFIHDAVPVERVPVVAECAACVADVTLEERRPFQDLLAQLNEQHESELRALQLEVVRLKSRLESSEVAPFIPVSTLPSAASTYGPVRGEGSLMSLLDSGPAKTISSLPAPVPMQMRLSGVGRDVEHHQHAQEEATSHYVNMTRVRSAAEDGAGQRWELLQQWTDPKVTSTRTRLASIFEYVENDITQRKRPPEAIEQDVYRPPHSQSWSFLLGSREPSSGHFTHFPLIHPSSTLKEVWDFFGLVILAIDAIWIPLQVFDVGQAIGARALNMCITMFWTLDMCVCWVAGYYDAHGEVVMSFRPIARRYLRSWFLLDVLILGSDWYMITSTLLGDENTPNAGDSVGLARLGKMMRFARILRALRLVRLLKVRQLLYRVQENISSERFAIVCGVANNIILVAFLQHYIACIWYWLGDSLSGATWVKEYIEPGADFDTRYLLSLHWCLAQFTPAPLEVTPQNMAERIFNVIYIFVSLVIFSSFMSSITTSMVRLKSLGSEYTVQVFMLRKFLKDNRISPELAARISRYIDLALEMHKKRTDRSQVQLLHLLSGPLNIMLQREVFEPHLVWHTLFQDYKKASSAALSQLCYSALSEACVSKGDLLFMAGSMAYSMWFLHTGSMVYKRMKHLKIKVRRTTRILTRTPICESVLWVEWFHHGTMISLIESDLVCLDAAKFREITMDNPSAMNYARRYAQLFLEQIKEHPLLDIPYEMARKPSVNHHRKGHRHPIGGPAPSPAVCGNSGVEVTSAELVEAHIVCLATGTKSDSDNNSDMDSFQSFDAELDSCSSEYCAADVIP